MNKLYKNQRAQFKAEKEQKERELENAQRRISALESAEKKRLEDRKKWYSIVVFCGHCQRVRGISCAPGFNMNTGTCLYCNVAGFLKQIIDDENRF